MTQALSYDLADYIDSYRPLSKHELELTIVFSFSCVPRYKSLNTEKPFSSMNYPFSSIIHISLSCLLDFNREVRVIARGLQFFEIIYKLHNFVTVLVVEAPEPGKGAVSTSICLLRNY